MSALVFPNRAPPQRMPDYLAKHGRFEDDESLSCVFCKRSLFKDGYCDITVRTCSFSTITPADYPRVHRCAQFREFEASVQRAFTAMDDSVDENDLTTDAFFVDKYGDLFEKGIALLVSASEVVSIAEAYALLDTAIGFCSVPVLDMSNERYVAETAGMSKYSEWGLDVLPVHIVRHVEYERVARNLLCENYLSLIHANAYQLLEHLENWKVKDQDGALNYLAFACMMERTGNSFAAASIDWLLEERSPQFPKSRHE